MTGDFAFGGALGFFGACVLFFVAGWLRQSAREWAAEIEETGR